MPQDRKAVRFSAPSLKRLSVDLLYDILGSFFFALGVYNFAVQANFAPGGVTGIATILNYLFGLPVGVTSMVINLPLFFFAIQNNIALWAYN